VFSPQPATGRFGAWTAGLLPGLTSNRLHGANDTFAQLQRIFGNVGKCCEEPQRSEASEHVDRFGELGVLPRPTRMRRPIEMRLTPFSYFCTC
jgi:hypothetical protein